MAKLKNPSRRKFLQSTAAASGALVVGVSLPDVFVKSVHAATDPSTVNAWVKVGSDNTVTILCARRGW